MHLKIVKSHRKNSEKYGYLWPCLRPYCRNEKFSFRAANFKISQAGSEFRDMRSVEVLVIKKSEN